MNLYKKYIQFSAVILAALFVSALSSNTFADSTNLILKDYFSTKDLTSNIEYLEDPKANVDTLNIPLHKKQSEQSKLRIYIISLLA